MKKLVVTDSNGNSATRYVPENCSAYALEQQKRIATAYLAYQSSLGAKNRSFG